ncbi:MAG: hypothetical protein EPO20_05810 [Betaproteobacteria bacterium]|nr:MAG: hypothetical protein EPO20_05810 [Betaproteobacteria bacterium]
MDVAILLLLPLVGGYLFSGSCNLTRYLASREQGHRLYFRAALWGFVLFVLALVLRQWLKAEFETYRAVEAKFHGLIGPYFKDPDKGYSFDLTVAAVGALLLSVPVSKLWNLFYWRGTALAKAISHDYFEQLLNEAVARTIPIAVSMKGRKVYVGFVTQTFDPSHDRKWIKILPLVSGYRDNDTMRIVFVTNYRDAYGTIDPANRAAPLAAPLGHLAPKDFGIVLPVDEIQSANLFDLVAYKAFKTGQLAGKASATSQPVGVRRSSVPNNTR